MPSTARPKPGRRPPAPRQTIGSPRPRRAPASELKAELTAYARAHGASVVGFAPVSRWAAAGEVPAAYRPDAIWPRARTVVTFGAPMLLPLVDSTPSIHHQELYDTVNRLLDDLAYRLSVWLLDRGHGAVNLARDGYGSLEALLLERFGAFSHVMAGKYAGLGTLGVSHNLVTPEYGPRLRLASIFTDVELPGDALREEDVCNGCNVCVRLCPAGALGAREDALLADLDKDACTRHHIALRDEKRWPCGVCIKVCPIGRDRAVFGGLKTKDYLDEEAALAADPGDPRYAGLVHLRRHGSLGDRIS